MEHDAQFGDVPGAVGKSGLFQIESPAWIDFRKESPPKRDGLDDLAVNFCNSLAGRVHLYRAGQSSHDVGDAPAGLKIRVWPEPEHNPAGILIRAHAPIKESFGQIGDQFLAA